MNIVEYLAAISQILLLYQEDYDFTNVRLFDHWFGSKITQKLNGFRGWVPAQILYGCIDLDENSQ